MESLKAGVMIQQAKVISDEEALSRNDWILIIKAWNKLNKNNIYKA